jgi:hypothetical protein
MMAMVGDTSAILSVFITYINNNINPTNLWFMQTLTTKRENATFFFHMEDAM